MFFDLHLARIIFTFARTTRRDARTRRQYKKFFVRTAISPPFSRKTTPHCELFPAARNARVTPSKTIYIISTTLCPKPLSARRKRRGNTRFVTLPPLHSAARRGGAKAIFPLLGTRRCGAVRAVLSRVVASVPARCVRNDICGGVCYNMCVWRDNETPVQKKSHLHTGLPFRACGGFSRFRQCLLMFAAFA